MEVLSLDRVSKSFGPTEAVKDLSFRLEAGAMFGLLGPNGAGKTTAIRMIMNIIMPDTGSIRVCGERNSRSALDRVGYLPEERGLYRKMKVGDVLTFFGEMKGLTGSEARRRSAVCLERFGMGDSAGKKVEELSKGNQQKIQLIVTVLHEPRLVILDEPFTGLDPVNAQLVKDVLLELKETGCCVVISTHLMEQVEKLCDAICLIDKGRSVLQGRLADVKKQFGTNTVLIEYDGDAAFLEGLDAVAAFDDFGKYVEVRLTDPQRAQELLKIAADRVRIRRFELMEPTLHEIFIETVKGGGKCEDSSL